MYMYTWEEGEEEEEGEISSEIGTENYNVY